MKENASEKEIKKIKTKDKKTTTKKVKKERTKKDKINFAFGMVYAVLLLAFLIIAIIDGHMPYSETGEFVFFVLTFVIIELFLFLMFTQNLSIHKNKKKRLLSYFGFVVNAVIFALRLVSSGDLILILLFVYNTVLTLYLIIDFWIYKTKFKTFKFFDKKLYIVIAFTFIFAVLNSTTHTYINDGMFWLYALIVMAVIMIVFAILSFTVFKKSYQLYAKKVWAKIAVVFIAMVFSFGYGLAFIDIANTSFNNNPEQIECVIVDKNITGTGYRQITHYNLYVLIDGKKITIDVSSDLYKSKEIDDTLIVNYNKGNLNLPYYESGEIM